MPYQLDINLQHTAALHAAILFWNKPHVKDRMIEFFNVHDEHDDYMEARSDWNQLTKEVLETWNTNTLPRTLEGELIHIIKEIGRKIFDWSQYIKLDNGCQLVPGPQTPTRSYMYVSNICWTSYGTIDEVMTYKKLFLNHPNFNVFNLYKIACKHALEDEIDYLWHRVPGSIQQHLVDSWHDDDDRYILIYWKYRRDRDYDYFRSCFDIWNDPWDHPVRIRDPYDDPFYNEVLSVEENMLLASIQRGYHNAVKYFWKKLTPEMRNNIITECLHVTLRCYSDYSDNNKSITNYMRERWIEIFLFLMAQMSAEQKEAFYNTTLRVERSGSHRETNVDQIILWMFPYAWPWQNLLIPVLNGMFQRQKLPDKIIYHLLSKLTKQMVENHKLGYVVSNSKHQSLFQAVWWNMPKGLKQMIAKKSLMYGYAVQNFVCNLLDVDDMVSIDMIFNDPDVANVRYQLIISGKLKYQDWIINDKYEVINQFIDKMFRSGTQKVHFMRDVDILTYFVKKDQFDLAEKFLNWQSWRPEENEYLSSCVKGIRKHKFQEELPAVNWICEIWKKCSSMINQAEERSLKFLNWLLESEYEINCFKREKLAKSETKIILTRYLVPIDVIERFFYWCGSTEEEVEQIMSNN